MLHIINPVPEQNARADSAAMRGNPDEAIEFLKHLDLEGRHQLAADPWAPTKEFQTFEPGEWKAMRKWIADRIGRRNLYYRLNEPCGGLGRKAVSKDKLANLRAIGIDFDPDKDKPLESERQRIRKLIESEIEAHEECFASAIVDSGNGFQTTWRLDKKIPATPENIHRTESQTRGIMQRLGGDGAAVGGAQLLRLPGTINIPNESKRKLGRVNAPARLIDMSDQALSLDDFARWIAPEAKPFRQAQRQAPLVELDKPENVQRYRRWLIDDAPEAVEGAHGDNTTVKVVAAKGKDFGVSEQKCLELMLDHWNDEKAIPPWDPDDLATKVHNAYAHCRDNAPGCADPAAEFELAGALITDTSSAWPTATPFRNRDPREIPKRHWIVPGMLARTFVSGLVAPGGTGKTQLIVNTCLAIASGSEKPLGRKISERTRVWYWNQEDDLDELDRRFAAARQHYGISAADISIDGAPALYVDSGVGRSLVLAERKRDRSIGPNDDAMKALIAEIKARKIGVFIFDPLAEFHEANENDNVEMRRVMAVARRIAVEGDCAVLVVAHTYKPPKSKSDGFAGDFDTLRGAGSQGNVIRLGLTLYGMSHTEAKTFSVPEKDRKHYVRLDLAKTNLCRRDGVPYWFKFVSVHVGGFEDGEPIGILEPVALKEHGGDSGALEILAKTMPPAQAGSNATRNTRWPRSLSAWSHMSKRSLRTRDTALKRSAARSLNRG